MNDRSTALLLIAVLLAGYGVYIAGHVPAMLVGPPVPLLLIGFVVQAGHTRGDAGTIGTMQNRSNRSCVPLFSALFSAWEEATREFFPLHPRLRLYYAGGNWLGCGLPMGRRRHAVSDLRSRQ